MITNNGITLLGKYLTGQTPAFASHIAIGCGPDVLGSDESFGDYSTKTSLDFETERFPIISRTTNVIDGEQQIIFTAEIPSEARYGITEVGIYPAESNNIVGSLPSQSIFSFTTNENWQKSLSSTVTDVELETDIIDYATYDIGSVPKAFFLSSDNAMFRSSTRLQRREQPRFLNTSLVVRGDLTALSSGELDTSGDHIIISQPTLPDLDLANVYGDKLKLVFSVIEEQLEAYTYPALIKIKVIFYAGAQTATYAYSGTQTSLTTSYIFDEQTLDSMDITSSFAWKDVTSVKIFANADSSSTVYLALDGIRFENLSSIDDRYALAGYTKLKLSDTTAAQYPTPVEKPEGSTTYVEFRFALDVV